jgi:hypothetical protein
MPKAARSHTAPLTRLRTALSEFARAWRDGTTADAQIRSVLDITDVMNERRIEAARREGFQLGLEWGARNEQTATAVAATLPQPRRHLALATATGPTTAITQNAGAR